MNLKHSFKNKRAFTLLETVMALAILSMLLAVFYGIFQLSIRTYQSASQTEDLYYQGTHVLDYISSEIQSADFVYPMEETGISDDGFHLGFLLCNKNKASSPTSYRYVYYVFSNHTLSRKACHSYIKDIKNLRASQFTKNVLSTDVKNIHHTALYEDHIILEIELEVDGKTKIAQTSISTYLKEHE